MACRDHAFAGPILPKRLVRLLVPCVRLLEVVVGVQLQAVVQLVRQTVVARSEPWERCVAQAEGESRVGRHRKSARRCRCRRNSCLSAWASGCVEEAVDPARAEAAVTAVLEVVAAVGPVAVAGELARVVVATVAAAAAAMQVRSAAHVCSHDHRCETAVEAVVTCCPYDLSPGATGDVAPVARPSCVSEAVVAVMDQQVQAGWQTELVLVSIAAAAVAVNVTMNPAGPVFAAAAAAAAAADHRLATRTVVVSPGCRLCRPPCCCVRERSERVRERLSRVEPRLSCQVAE